MGFCSRRNIFLSICLLQMISVIERQVFDFLGFLWIPILINFFEIILVILGFFGTYQYRPKYVVSYVIWQLLWLGWNLFIICLYLDVANLNHKTNKILKLDPKSESWWSNEGPGCKKIVSNEEEPWKTSVENCLVNYVHVEVFQSGLQCFISLFGIFIGMCLSRVLMCEDDKSSVSRKSSSRKNPKRTSLYSIEFSPQDNGHDSDVETDQVPNQISPKPMTPRRVKRRSVMTRGSSGRHSMSSRRQSNTARSSTRSSRRLAQNPVVRLLEQQQQHQQQQQQQHKAPNSNAYDNTTVLAESPLSNYYKSVSNSNLNSNENWHAKGHSNPTYQQSSMQSLNDTEEFEDIYNNRPASVRSSYSNFHGTRTIHYGTGSKHYHSHATPQVPQKRNGNHSNRNSMRSMAFFKNGPPAYSSQGQTSVDSETTI